MAQHLAAELGLGHAPLKVVAQRERHAHGTGRIVCGAAKGLDEGLTHGFVVREREDLLELIHEQQYGCVVPLGQVLKVERQQAGRIGKELRHVFGADQVGATTSGA